MGNFITKLFDSLFTTSKSIKRLLDYYWKNNMMKEYWELFYKMNNEYNIIKNPDGKHTVKKR